MDVQRHRMARALHLSELLWGTVGFVLAGYFTVSVWDGYYLWSPAPAYDALLTPAERFIWSGAVCIFIMIGVYKWYVHGAYLGASGSRWRVTWLRYTRGNRGEGEMLQLLDSSSDEAEGGAV